MAFLLLGLLTLYLPDCEDDSSVMKRQPLEVELENRRIYLGSLFVMFNEAFKGHGDGKTSDVPL